jgi:hypothetical protein
MNKRIIKITSIKNKDNAFAYWLSKPASERIEAVEILRKQLNGNAKRFQRTIRIIQQAQG